MATHSLGIFSNVLFLKNKIVTCMLCDEETEKTHTNTGCGEKECQSTVCEECLNNWYSVPQLGIVVLNTNLCCPFCKKKPTSEFMEKYNEKLAPLLSETELEVDWYYGWCMQCKKIRQVVKQSCIRSEPEISNFVCDMCIPPPYETKKCPACGLSTEKSGGCNHMQCTKCKKNWCWVCQISLDENYEPHFRRIHHSYFSTVIYDDGRDRWGSDSESDSDSDSSDW